MFRTYRKKSMHRLLQSYFLLVLGLAANPVWAVDTDLHYRILNAKTAFAPFVRGNTAVWSYSASKNTKIVSLAFEHENYTKFHAFEKNQFGVFILSLPLPEIDKPLHYRLIVDGLWTTDPMAELETDLRGIQVSRVLFSRSSSKLIAGASILPNGKIQFVYRGKPGAQVSLIGDFNSWDPFLIPMPESPAYPGLYTTALLLPSDFRYYRFVVDGREIVDPANPSMAHNPWGEQASLLPKQ